MTSLLFLGIAVAIFLVGSLVLWLVSRERETLNSGIETFKSEMGALRPPSDDATPPGSPRG